MSTFLRNDWTVELEQVMFEYNLHTIFFPIIACKTFTLLLSSSNDASADIIDDEGSFEFSPKDQFTSP